MAKKRIVSYDEHSRRFEDEKFVPLTAAEQAAYKKTTEKPAGKAPANKRSTKKPAAPAPDPNIDNED